MERQGAVRLLDVVSVWNPPNEWSGTVDSSRPFIVWFEDQPDRQWGAEFSSRQVIKVGKELDYQIHYMGQQNFSASALVLADLIVLNNFAFLDQAQFKILMGILFQHFVLYVRYAHYAFFCVNKSPLCLRRMTSNQVRCRNCAKTKFHYYPRQMLMWKLFASSVLNVFISPLQREIHQKALGDVVDPSFLLMPPIDTEFFRPVKGVNRDKHRAVSMTGKIWYANKGLKNLLEYAVKNKDDIFDVYTKPHGNLLIQLELQTNINIRKVVEYKLLPRIYSGVQKVIHLPCWPEAAGRTIMEGFLCGCEPVMNSNCGVAHFDFPWNDREQVRTMLKLSPYKFWAEISKAMNWSEKGQLANAVL